MASLPTGPQIERLPRNNRFIHVLCTHLVQYEIFTALTALIVTVSSLLLAIVALSVNEPKGWGDVFPLVSVCLYRILPPVMGCDFSGSV